MRLWHFERLPYLPDAQFKGQLRELVAIMHDWRDKGATNHILINRVMEYPKADLYGYYLEYAAEYERRNNGKRPKTSAAFREFADGRYTDCPFEGWHNRTYLRICMANLYEKHLNEGKSRITAKEWNRILKGYRQITGEDYII